MPLSNYGLLTGSLVAHGDQHGGNPHYLLSIDTGGVHFRVAVNLRSTEGTGAATNLQYQIVPDLTKAGAKAKALAAKVQRTNRFDLASNAEATLDFVRDGVLDMTKFATVGDKNIVYYKGLVAAANKVQQDQGAYVAVFGTGYANDDSDPKHSSSGFAGVDNVHMNQGSYKTIDNHTDEHYKENGPNQDGAVLFYFSDGSVQGFFSKFQSQDEETDANGNPTNTNVVKLDDTPEAVAKALTAGVERRKKKAAKMKLAIVAAHERAHFKGAAKKAGKPSKAASAAAAGAPASGFIFADPASAPPPSAAFKPDDDSNVDHNFVDQFAKHGVPGAGARPA